MTTDNLKYIFEILKKDFYKDETELNYSTPFQLLVAVILSAQTTDKQVNKITSGFFYYVKSPQDVVDLWYEKREVLIKSVNFFRNKAKNIFKTAQILSKSKSKLEKNKTPSSLNSFYPEGQRTTTPFLNNNYKIPDKLKSLIELPWVWEKTARVMLHVLYKKAVVAVDTHVQRVTNRLWIVDTKSPLETSKLLEKILPLKYKKIAHHSLIYFGRYLCTARNPKCNECKFTKICKYYKTVCNS